MSDSLRQARLSLRELSENFSFRISAERLSWIIIGFGIILRTGQYLFNRSLWIDEATLALNIVNRSLAGLLLPLDDNQAAPLGFLVIERLAILSFGNNEYALRLFPFACGIASLILFYAVARRCLDRWAAAIALALFAVADNLIYYASEVKQYSSDVAIAIVILLVALKLYSRRLNTKLVLLASAIGSLVVWISHPSVFVLAGAGTCLALFALREKDWKRALTLALIGSSWALSFAASYFVSLGDLSSNEALEGSWQRRGTFMPFPPRSLSDLAWFPVTFIKLFYDPLYSPLPLLAALVFIFGCVSAWRKRDARLLLIISPVFFALAASALHKYPFGRRLLLFAVPSLLIFIAEGARYVMTRRPPYYRALGLAVIALLLLEPLARAGWNLIHPRTREEVRQVIAYMKTREQPEDSVYLYYGSTPAFRYYATRFGYDEGDYIAGTRAREEWSDGTNQAYIDDLNKLRGRERVWVIFSHVFTLKNVSEEDYIVSYLDGIGTRLDSFAKPGAAVYLYDLRDKRVQAGLY